MSSKGDSICVKMKDVKMVIVREPNRAFLEETY